jgi:hypothetical protein
VNIPTHDEAVFSVGDEVVLTTKQHFGIEGRVLEVQEMDGYNVYLVKLPLKKYFGCAWPTKKFSFYACSLALVLPVTQF